MSRSKRRGMGRIRNITFSHDGKYYVIIACDHQVYVFDANTKMQLRCLIDENMMSIFDHLSFAKFSMDDKHLWICDLHGDILIYETSTFTLVYTIGNDDLNPMKSYLEFSSDGKYFIHGRKDTNVKIYHASTFKLVHKLSTEKTSLRGISLSADSRQLAIGEHGRTKIYDMNTFKLLHIICIFELPNYYEDFKTSYNVCFSGDGKYLANVGNQSTKIVDAQTFQEITILREPNAFRELKSFQALFSKNGKHMAILSTSNHIFMYDTKTFQEVYNSKRSNIFAVCFAFSMDEQWLFIGDELGYMHLLNLTTFKMEKLKF